MIQVALETKEDLIFRIKVAHRVCELLRQALEFNDNRYSGSLAPNLTSVTDCLTIPIDILKQQVAITPQLRDLQSQ